MSLSAWLPASPWILALLVILYRYATRRPQLRDYAPAPAGPLVSVIIPARNEARNIERCVRSILATTYPMIEVIVVDDGSTDGTGDLVERLGKEGRVRLVRGAELPPAWFGKQWALVQGYRVARGELLLFADADTKHEPELIARAVTARAAERADLFSVIPRQEMLTFWERLIQPHVFLALQARVGDLRRVNRTRIAWNAIANGQFILVTRSSYEGIGTHEAVKSSVADDVMLAQAYVRYGLDIFLAHAANDMSTRMYGSLKEIVAGWSKNLALGAPLMAPPVRWIRAALPYVMWMPAVLWLAPPIAWAAFGWPCAAIATIASLITWVGIYAGERAPVQYALLYPLGAVMVAYIMIRSAWRGGSKVEWRGRTYRGSGSHQTGG
jgi:chlorobactene glucosyltransferase